MAVTLNASASAGLITTADTSTILQLQTGGTTAVTVDASQNVGIGTTSPVAKLSVDHAIALTGAGAAKPASLGYGIYLLNGLGTVLYSAASTAFYSGDAERARLDAAGNLGVGTTSPQAYTGFTVLTVDNATNGGVFTVRKAGVAKLNVYADSDFGIIEGVGSSIGLKFLTNNAVRATIDTSGRLLVGVTTAPDTAARGVFNSSSGANIVISSSVLSNGNSSYFSARNIDTVRRDCDIGVYKHAGITNSCGYVGYVEEEGTAQYTWVGNDGNLRISVDASAIGTNGGTVVGTQSSDERIKNIVGEVQYGLNEILALEPIAFAMKDSPDNKKLGFSAQQVQPIIPEAVYDTGDCIDGYDVDPENKMERTPKSDRTKLSMEYTQIVPVLVKAIQEQQAIIQTLTDRITALEGTTP